MNSFWLIPDYSQSGTVLCASNGVTKPVHEALPLARIPLELVLGIPEELLTRHNDNDFVFAQFCRGRNEEAYFACSIRAGLDVSGRTVTLTNLQCLTSGETPKVPPDVADLPRGDADRAMRRLIDLLDHSTPQRQSVFDMLDAAAALPRVLSFASETMRKSANPPQWMPYTHKKKVTKRVIPILLMLLLSALVTWLNRRR